MRVTFEIKEYMIGTNEHKFDTNKNNDVGFPATSYLGINVGINFTFGN